MTCGELVGTISCVSLDNHYRLNDYRPIDRDNTLARISAACRQHDTTLSLSLFLSSLLRTL
jgi:hypothetical protein